MQSPQGRASRDNTDSHSNVHVVGSSRPFVADCSLLLLGLGGSGLLGAAARAAATEAAEQQPKEHTAREGDEQHVLLGGDERDEVAAKRGDLLQHVLLQRGGAGHFDGLRLLEVAAREAHERLLGASARELVVVAVAEVQHRGEAADAEALALQSATGRLEGR